ncbi:hypothetical protein RFI_09236 [Reticulomyxa filosa]|uniref:Uncharacterized protein n=1 Tax=Reticulomyxa filosa TaxID=46433 RepID=X6NNR8_RETFI|nr:hypothetical protein RFI_09236 [Reticulomyxa filosa]|eukprot:ETO27895.1 hypothetical protein RFI_09236 [Reticulomyxa filosa]
MESHGELHQTENSSYQMFQIRGCRIGATILLICCFRWYLSFNERLIHHSKERFYFIWLVGMFNFTEEEVPEPLVTLEWSSSVTIVMACFAFLVFALHCFHVCKRARLLPLIKNGCFLRFDKLTDDTNDESSVTSKTDSESLLFLLLLLLYSLLYLFDCTYTIF